MLIGDRIIVTNHARRNTQTLGKAGSPFAAWWDAEVCAPYEGLFVGWTTVQAGIVQPRSTREGLYGEEYPIVGRLIHQHAVRVAVVQPVSGEQWRKPRYTLIVGEPHPCHCGEPAQLDGLCSECVQDRGEPNGPSYWKDRHAYRDYRAAESVRWTEPAPVEHDTVNDLYEYFGEGPLSREQTDMVDRAYRDPDWRPAFLPA